MFRHNEVLYERKNFYASLSHQLKKNLMKFHSRREMVLTAAKKVIVKEVFVRD